VSFIHENYSDENLNVNTIAQHFGANQSNLSKLFKKEMDIGLLEYINIFRVNKAAQLLKTTDESVTEISRMAGYTNYRTFTRVFSKQYGITAMQYREMNRK